MSVINLLIHCINEPTNGRLSATVFRLCFRPPDFEASDLQEIKNPKIGKCEGMQPKHDHKNMLIGTWTLALFGLIGHKSICHGCFCDIISHKNMYPGCSRDIMLHYLAFSIAQLMID